MNIKSIIVLKVKVIALTIVFFISFTVMGGLVIGESVEPAEEAGASLLPLLVVCFLNSSVLTYPIVRSRWSGFRLIAVVFVVLFGIMSVMSQIEAAFFMTNIPAGLIPRFVLWGALVALIFSPLAVLILGRIKREAAEGGPNLRLVMPWGEWVWKLAVVAVLYITLYFTFGYFIAWQNPELRQFYSGSTELLGFFPHMRNTLISDPRLLALQVLRSMMWVAIVLPVIRMMKGQWWEAGLAVGLLFAVLGSAGLLLPNPYMSETIRMSHLVETTSSNFIFGWLVVWLLNRHHASLRRITGKHGRIV